MSAIVAVLSLSPEPCAGFLHHIERARADSTNTVGSVDLRTTRISSAGRVTNRLSRALSLLSPPGGPQSGCPSGYGSLADAPVPRAEGSGLHDSACGCPVDGMVISEPDGQDMTGVLVDLAVDDTEPRRPPAWGVELDPCESGEVAANAPLAEEFASYPPVRQGRRGRLVPHPARLGLSAAPRRDRPGCAGRR